MRRNPAHPPVDRERHLDDLVEDRRITRRTPGAMVFLAVHVPQRGARIEHAPTARAQHIPRELEEAEARGVQKGGDRFLFVETPLRREIQHVDPAEVAIRRIPHQLLDRTYDAGIGGLLQKRKQVFGFAHFKSYPALLRGKTRRASEIARVSCRSDAIALAPSPPCRRHSALNLVTNCARASYPAATMLSALLGDNGS